MTGSKSAPDRDPERLVRDYADLVLRVCYTYLRSTADAEDVCQDTLVKLLLREESFHDPGHERAWVVRVAINACRNLLRDRGAHPTVGLGAVMALPLPQREAVYLHYYEGYPTREVARIVGATDDAVRQRLSRARASLRDDLKGDYDDFPA